MIFAFAIVLAPEVSAQMNDPLGAVNTYIGAFNKGDAKAMGAVVLVEGEKHGASGYAVTLGKPRHLDVNGDAAYVVLPATMTFKLKGKQVTQTGATWTAALRKVDDG